MTTSRSARQRQRQVARWVRKAPGFRFALHEVLPRVRRSPVLNDLAWRVFVPSHLAGQVVVPFRGGVHLAGADVPLLPVVGVLSLGATREQAVAMMEQLADLQRRTRGFRPLLLVDVPVFAEARAHGYVVDLLGPRDGAFGSDAAWEAYVAHRAAGAVDDYQLWSLLTVAPTGLTALDVALLEQLGARLPADRRVHAVEPAT